MPAVTSYSDASPLLSTCECLDILDKNIISVIGCGGKTSFIEKIAGDNPGKSILISPTTKIRPMRENSVTLCETLDACENHIPRRGIQCLGLLSPDTGKLTALPEDLLSRLAADYDIALLEADGSAGLPCKGWLETEPVIPSYTTHTVGIAVLSSLGKPATKENTLRLPEFLSLTGLGEGDIITIEALIKMICSKNGMFKNSFGKRLIFINQVEDEEQARAARRLLEGIRRKYPGRFDGLYYGSVKSDSWREAAL